MKHYYYIVTDNPKRGYNKLVKVWSINKNTGHADFIGGSNEHTAAWRGAKAVASLILQRDLGLESDGYEPVDSSIRLHQIEC